MTITIARKDNQKNYQQDYTFSFVSSNTKLLHVLKLLKTTVDPTLTFRSGCRSGVCGSCAVKVNGKEKLACKYTVQNGDFVEPIGRLGVIRDLIVESEMLFDVLKRAKSFLHTRSAIQTTADDEANIEKQSECILCQACYSSCPVVDVNKSFLGPFALTKAYRYVADLKEKNKKEILDTIQESGVWDCTLCGNCTIVCPQHIDPKYDIIMLRNKSVQDGYQDRQNNAHNNDFGFDPNFFY